MVIILWPKSKRIPGNIVTPKIKIIISDSLKRTEECECSERTKEIGDIKDMVDDAKI